MSEEMKKTAGTEPEKSAETVALSAPSADLEKQNISSDTDAHEYTPQTGENVFLQSLKTVNADQLGAPREKKDDAERKKQRLIRIASLVIVFGFLAYAVANMVYRVVSYRRAGELYDGLQQEFESALDPEKGKLMTPAKKSQMLSPMSASGVSDPIPVEKDDDEDEDDGDQMIKLQLKRLQSVNEDAFAWIKIPGDTGVSYPVMFGQYNEYYLYHAFDGSENPTGAIFLDVTCSKALETNENSVIWGHNMQFDTPMFHNLLRYADNVYYWQNNRYIFIYTEERTYRYEIYSAYMSEPKIRGIGFFSTDIYTREEKETFIRKSIEKNSIGAAPEIVPTADDRILTLCTCDQDGEKRFVVHARLMNDYELIDGKNGLSNEW